MSRCIVNRQKGRVGRDAILKSAQTPFQKALGEAGDFYGLFRSGMDSVENGDYLLECGRYIERNQIGDASQNLFFVETWK